MPPARIEQSNNKMPQTVRTILTTFINTSQFQSDIITLNAVALPIMPTNMSNSIYLHSIITTIHFPKIDSWIIAGYTYPIVLIYLENWNMCLLPRMPLIRRLSWGGPLFYIKQA